MFKPFPAQWLVLIFALPAIAAAQAAAPAVPKAAMTEAEPAAFNSALDGYQPYTDEKTVNWKEANDNAGRIGGWREYAKEASQAQTPEGAAKPDPRAVPAKQ